MNPVSRRSFLARTGVAAVRSECRRPSDRNRRSGQTRTLPTAYDEPDRRPRSQCPTGEVSLYVGTEEITYTDRVLARRLARAARHAD